MAFLKICCIASTDEARIAQAAGASALGLVARMPSGPGVIDDARIAEIVRAVRGVETFLLTCETEVAAIVAHADRTGASAVQLVDHVERAVLLGVRALRPRLRIVQVVHVEDEGAIELAAGFAPHVDALLLDSGSPSASVLGGTGRAHDWAISARIVETSSVPVFLAGGLRPENVEEAIARVRPHGLDVCSGLRTGGALDPQLVQRFVGRFAVTRPPIWA